MDGQRLAEDRLGRRPLLLAEQGPAEGGEFGRRVRPAGRAGAQRRPPREAGADRRFFSEFSLVQVGFLVWTAVGGWFLAR